MIETSGAGMNSDRSLVRWARSSAGVNPAACTSLTRGSEILPSGLTGTDRLIASLRQTEISSTSSGPIRYDSPMPLPAAGDGGVAATAVGDALVACACAVVAHIAR